MFRLLLIWRYFISRRVAFLAVGAVALLVMMVLVVLSVMTGLLDDTRKRNHNWSGDVILSRDSLVGFGYYDEFITVLDECELVEESTAVVRTFGLLGAGGTAEFYGVRLDEFCRVTEFKDTLWYQKNKGEVNFEVPAGGMAVSAEQRRRGGIAGVYQLHGGWDKEGLKLQRESWLRPGNDGWMVTVFGVTYRGTLAGAGLGTSQMFYYVDDSDSGLVDIDRMALYVDFAELQGLCSMDGSDGGVSRASEIRVRLKDGVELWQGKNEVGRLWREFKLKWGREKQGKLLDDVKVQSWKGFRRDQIAIAENEKAMMTVVFVLIGLMAVFIIFAIFYMIVLEKYRDLGIIKSVGGSGWAVSSLFLGYGLLVGIVGSVTGTVAGVLIVINSNEIEAFLNRHIPGGFQIWDPSMYAISRIPDVVDVSQAIVICCVAILACVLGALIPACRAGSLVAVDALRVE